MGEHVSKMIQKRDGFYVLDVKGYVCPHPQLYMIKSLKELQPGNILEIVHDNPSSNDTIALICKKKGYTILETIDNSGVFKLKIQK